MRTRTSDKRVNYSHGRHKPNNKLVSAKLEYFWCTDEPHANMDSQDHHDPNLGKATTFPIIVVSVPGHNASTQMSFCPGTPKLESQNSLNWDSRDFGGP
jgi:hypothetical protein